MKRRYRIESPQRVRVADIRHDREFEHLVPLGPDESAQLVKSALQDAGTEPLVVWKWRRRLILLIGYHLFPALFQPRLTVPVIVKKLKNRAEACRFIINYHLRHGVLSRLALSYFRGKRCLADKLPPGGDRKSKKFRKSKAPENGTARQRKTKHRKEPVRTSFGPRRTIEAMADLYQVSRGTLINDIKLAEAIDRLVASCGTEIRTMLFRRECRMTWKSILSWGDKASEEQEKIWREYRFTKSLPESLKRGSSGERKTITIPRAVPELTAALIEKLPLLELRQVQQGLLDHLLARDTQANGAIPLPESNQTPLSDDGGRKREEEIAVAS